MYNYLLKMINFFLVRAGLALIMFALVFVATMTNCLASADLSELNCTTLAVAIKNNDRAAVLNIAESGFDINTECQIISNSLKTRHSVALTPLIVAIETGNLSIVNLLLGLGADINKAVKIEDVEGRIPVFFLPKDAPPDGGFGIEDVTLTPLLAAIIMQDVKMVENLLEKGSKPDESYVLLFDRFQNGKRVRGDKRSSSRLPYYPLKLAKIFKNNQMILSLLKYNVDLTRDADRTPPYILCFLIQNGADHQEIAEALKYTDANWKSGPNSPITKAVRSGDVELVKLLMNNGAHIIFKPNNVMEDQSLYSAAASSNNLDMVRFLRHLGLKPAKPDIFTKTWQTPISSAIYVNNLEIIDELINIGFDPNTKDSGWAPIHVLAKGKGNPAALKVLIKHGVDVNAAFTNTCGDYDPPCNKLEKTGNITPMMYAVYEHPDPYEIVKSLTENGARASTKTKTGLTAADIWNARSRMCRLRLDEWETTEKLIYSGSLSVGRCSFHEPEKISELVDD